MENQLIDVLGASDPLPSFTVVDLPSACAYGPSGHVFVAFGNRVLIYDPKTCQFYKFCGQQHEGYAEGDVSVALFRSILGLAVTEDGELLIADSGNHRIRIVSKNRVVSTLAGSGEVGFKNGPFSVSQFSSPSGICISSSGNIFVSDRGNHVIRHINRSDQEVTLHCGYPGWAGNSSGFHTNATLYHPGSLRIGYGGEILVVPELYLREKPFHVYAIHREGYCRKRYKIPNVSGIQDIFPGPNGVYFTRKVSGSLLIQDLEGDH
jgi:hypothetical protein